MGPYRDNGKENEKIVADGVYLGVIVRTWDVQFRVIMQSCRKSCQKRTVERARGDLGLDSPQEGQGAFGQRTVASPVLKKRYLSSVLQSSTKLGFSARRRGLGTCQEKLP